MSTRWLPGAIGIGTAWLVTAHRFPGRDAFAWLLPLPRPLWRTALVGFLMGGGSFALFFTGMKTATPSSSPTRTSSTWSH